MESIIPVLLLLWHAKISVVKKAYCWHHSKFSGMLHQSHLSSSPAVLCSILTASYYWHKEWNPACLINDSNDSRHTNKSFWKVCPQSIQCHQQFNTHQSHAAYSTWPILFNTPSVHVQDSFIRHLPDCLPCFIAVASGWFLPASLCSGRSPALLWLFFSSYLPSHPLQAKQITSKLPLNHTSWVLVSLFEFSHLLPTV